MVSGSSQNSSEWSAMNGDPSESSLGFLQRERIYLFWSKRSLDLALPRVFHVAFHAVYLTLVVAFHGYWATGLNSPPSNILFFIQTAGLGHALLLLIVVLVTRWEVGKSGRKSRIKEKLEVLLMLGCKTSLIVCAFALQQAPRICEGSTLCTLTFAFGAVNVLFFGLCVFFQSTFLFLRDGPSQATLISCVDGRVQGGLAVYIPIIALCWMDFIPQWVQVTVPVLFGSLLWLNCFYHLPFIRMFSDMIHCGVFAFLAFVGLARLHESFISCLIALGLASLLGWLLCLFRFNILFRFVKELNHMQDSSEEPVQFAAQRIVRSSPEDFMVEIKLRGFYSKARVLSDVIEETYKLALQKFPTSLRLRLDYSDFLAGTFQMMGSSAVPLIRAGKILSEVQSGAEDLRFRAFCFAVERVLSQTQAGGKGMSRRMVQKQLRKADHNRLRILKLLVDFWRSFFDRDEQKSATLQIIDRIANLETRTEAIFQKLQDQCTNQTSFLRSHALFLRDVQSRFWDAERLLRRCRRLEEQGLDECNVLDDGEEVTSEDSRSETLADRNGSQYFSSLKLDSPSRMPPSPSWRSHRAGSSAGEGELPGQLPSQEYFGFDQGTGKGRNLVSGSAVLDNQEMDLIRPLATVGGQSSSSNSNSRVDMRSQESPFTSSAQVAGTHGRRPSLQHSLESGRADDGGNFPLYRRSSLRPSDMVSVNSGGQEDSAGVHRVGSFGEGLMVIDSGRDSPSSQKALLGPSASRYRPSGMTRSVLPKDRSTGKVSPAPSPVAARRAFAASKQYLSSDRDVGGTLAGRESKGEGAVTADAPETDLKEESKLSLYSKVASYQERIDKNRSSDVKSMRIFTIIALATSGLLLMGLFIFAEVMIKDQHLLTQTATSADGNILFGFTFLAGMRVPTARSSIYGMIALSSLTGAAPTTSASNVAIYQEIAEGLTYTINNVMTFRNPSSVMNALDATTATVSNFKFAAPMSFTPTPVVMNVLDMFSALQTATNTLYACFKTWYETGVKPTQAACFESAMFLNVNVKNGILPAIDKVVDVYRSEVNDEARTVEIAVISMTVTIAALLIVVVGIFAIPVFRRLVKEREGVLKLFRLIPKATVLMIVTNVTEKVNRMKSGQSGDLGSSSLNAALDDGPTDDFGEEKDSQSMRGFRKFIMVYFMCFVLILVFVALFAWILIAYINTYRTMTKEVEFFFSIPTSEWLSLLDAVAIGQGTSTSEAFRQQTRERARTTLLLFNEMAYGSTKASLDGIIKRSSALDKAFFEAQCPGSSLLCLSLSDTIAEIAQDIIGVSLIPWSPSIAASFYYSRGAQVVGGSLNAMFNNAFVQYIEYMVPLITTYRTYAEIVFPISILAILLMWGVLLRPVFQKLEKESQRTKRILLMVPLDVIESVPTIKNFLLHGRKVEDKELLEAVKSSEKRMQHILDEAFVGHFQFDAKLKITDFNSEFKKMFHIQDDQDTSSLSLPQCFRRNRHFEYVEQALQSFLDQKVENKKFEVDLTGIPFESSACGDISRGAVKPSPFLANPGPSSSSAPPPVATNTNGNNGIPSEEVSSSGGPFPASAAFTFIRIQGQVFLHCFVRDVTATKKAQKLLAEEKKVSNNLLLNMLPADIAQRLKAKEHPIADHHPHATIMFLDLVSFTKMASGMEAAELVTLLGQFFNQLDEEADRWNITKIKTIGDAYMCVCGLGQLDSHQRTRAVIRMIEFCRRVLRITKKMNLQCRIGIHQGPVTAGVIGTKKFAYDLWGDSVNLASRMESSGKPMFIQISRPAYELVYDRYEFDARLVMLKGKGETEAYLLKDNLDQPVDD